VKNTQIWGEERNKWKFGGAGGIAHTTLDVCAWEACTQWKMDGEEDPLGTVPVYKGHCEKDIERERKRDGWLCYVRGEEHKARDDPYPEHWTQQRDLETSRTMVFF
jgi:hypothetical protein